MEFLDLNRKFWNRYSRERGPWSQRSPKALIDEARRGKVQIFITTRKEVPSEWLPKNWRGLKVLGLAAGGGQQMPIIAAAGATVTVLDISEEQLERDREVCADEGLSIETVQGDMRNLSRFQDGQFDLIVNPVSNCFVDDVETVWRECFRVLKPGGVLLSGFNNPVAYALDYEAYEKGELKLKNKIPYSDVTDLPAVLKAARLEKGDAFEFGHSLTSLIGGQIQAGFLISGFYEDEWGTEFKQPIDSILPQFIATRAEKLGKRM